MLTWKCINLNRHSPGSVSLVFCQLVLAKSLKTLLLVFEALDSCIWLLVNVAIIFESDLCETFFTVNSNSTQ